MWMPGHARSCPAMTGRQSGNHPQSHRTMSHKFRQPSGALWVHRDGNETLDDPRDPLRSLAQSIGRPT
jgi:hypothetical protein